MVGLHEIQQTPFRQIEPSEQPPCWPSGEQKGPPSVPASAPPDVDELVLLLVELVDVVVELLEVLVDVDPPVPPDAVPLEPPAPPLPLLSTQVAVSEVPTAQT